MKYIPGTLVITPNQLSARLLPKLNPRLIYKLIHIKPVKEEKEIKQVQYYFLEFVKPPIMKAAEQLDKVIINFNSIEEADIVFDKIMGIKNQEQIQENQQPSVSNAMRSKLNNIATKSFSRRRR